MTAKKKTPAKASAARADVTIYPTGEAWISDVEPVEQTVSAERADELLAYSPPAFTTKAPKVARGAKAPTSEAPVEPAPTETQPSDDAGATTSEVPA